LKFDSRGNEQWHIPIEAHHDISYDGTIIQTKDNGYIIVDKTAMTKLTSSGVLQWQRFSPIWYQHYNSIIETDDSGYLVVGLMGREGPTRGTITKFDSNGTQEWEKLFDGSAAITMSSCSQLVKTSGYTNSSHYMTAAIVKINANGELLWKKDYKPTYIDYVWELKAVEQKADKGFAVMEIKSWIWSGDGKEKGLWLLKTDENWDF